MYYLSMFAFESVGVKLPNCISDGWQPLASTHLAAAGRKSGQAFFLHAPWPAWVATKKANAFCGVWGDPEWIQEWFLLVHEDWLFWEGSWKWLNSITNVGESHHFIYCSNWNVPLFKADCPKRGLCFRVNKHATSIHLHWYIRRLCSGMNWCCSMLLLQKSVAFLKQLTAFGDREGCVVGYRLGASRSSSTVSDSLHQELMICQTKALWSNIRWIMASFFGDDSIVTMIAKWGVIPSRTNWIAVASQQSVDENFEPQKMGKNSVDAELLGASLLETKWCMAKRVVKLCSLKWWHNDTTLFFYRNLLNEHPPEKKCQHWPCKRHSLFLLPRTAGSLSIPCDTCGHGVVCFSPGLSPEVCALQNWASSDHHVRCCCFSVPKNGRLVDMAEWLFCEICVAKVSWKYFQCYLALNTGSEKNHVSESVTAHLITS